MIYTFCGCSADEAWNAALVGLQSQDLDRRDSRAGPVAELLHTAIQITNPRDRWITGRVPAMNPAFAIAEVIWILRGRSDARFLRHWNRSLPKFVGDRETLPGAYGARLRAHFGIDQLCRAAEVLKSRPDSRQVVLQIWDATQDLPGADGAPMSEDIPCNVSSMLKVRSGKLEWTQIMRSNDVFRGLPYNVVQFTFLQEVLAGWAGLEVGSYTHWSDSLHIYIHDIETVSYAPPCQMSRNYDLRLAKIESDRIFQVLEDLCEDLMAASCNSVLERLQGLDLPDGYLSLAAILCAEDARRRGQAEVAECCLNVCLEPSLSELFARWRAQRPIRK